MLSARESRRNLTNLAIIRDGNIVAARGTRKGARAREQGRSTLEDAPRFFPAATPTSLHCYYSFGWVLLGARVEHIIRAYGSPLSLSLAFLPSRRASPASPETLYLLLFISLSLLLSFFSLFFDQCLRSFGTPFTGNIGVADPVRLVTLPDACGTLVSTHRG